MAEEEEERVAVISDVIKPFRCPSSNECGYEGVWLHENLFREHMEKFHKGKGEVGEK